MSKHKHSKDKDYYVMAQPLRMSDREDPNAADPNVLVKKAHKHRRHKHGAGHALRNALIVIILVVLVAMGLAGFNAYRSVQSLRGEATTLLASVSGVTQSLSTGDAQSIAINTDQLDRSIRGMQAELSNPIWALAEHLPVYGADVSGVKELVDTAALLCDDVLDPAAQTLADYPLRNLVTDGAINAQGAAALCQMALDITPAVTEASARIGALGGFHIGQINDSLPKLQSTLQQASGLLQENQDVFTALPGILGIDGERLYLVVALNNDEARSCVGLPGAFVPITVDNGALEVGDVTDLAYLVGVYKNPPAITDEETVLFGESLASTPANMTFTPDFSRVSDLLTYAWEMQMGQHVSGVIAVDPYVFGDLIGLVGGATLSDGTVVNGQNAAKFLLYDTYISAGENLGEPDPLFAEVALAGAETVRNNISDVDFAKLADVLQRGIKEHRIFAWSENPGEEAVFDRLGCAGLLNSDPAEPETGIYFIDGTWSKIDWFLKSDVAVAEPVANEDGSQTYGITLTLTNTMTEGQAQELPQSITGFSPRKESVSDMVTMVYLYAPAGGSIGNLQVSGELRDIIEASHSGLQVTFGTSHLAAQQSLTLTYDVTVSPAAVEPLAVRTTALGR